MSAYAHRNRYLDDSITTASPSKLLTMLYDRLVLDIMRAEEAQKRSDRARANECLLHAQAIVLELRSSLRVDDWDGGPALASIYVFLHSELVGANVAGDVRRMESARKLVEPLRDAWHDALRLTSAGSGDPALVATSA